MSYYYDDTSHYCYTVPTTHYEDTSTYSYSVPTDYYSHPEPTYYDDPPSDPIHHNDFPPDSEPIYHDDDAVYHDSDTHAECAYFDDATAWSSPPPPTLYEDEDELEAYAEAASNRTYFEHEIHPAYRDSPINEGYTESSDTIEPPDVHTTLFHPPVTIDDMFYSLPDEALTECAEHYREIVGEMIDKGRNLPYPCEYTRLFEKFSQFGHQVETILKRRMDQRVEDEALKHWGNEDEVEDEKEDDWGDCIDVGEDEFDGEDHHHPQPQSTSPPHLTFDNDTVSTPPPDICIPNPLPLSPNIQYKPTRITSAFLITAIKRREPRYYFGRPIHRRRSLKHKAHGFEYLTRTIPPPDIRLPKPHPLSPNICSQPHQQPQRPAYTRPRRKHPPTRPPATPTPCSVDHRHNAVRRISKKSRIHSF